MQPISHSKRYILLVQSSLMSGHDVAAHQLLGASVTAEALEKVPDLIDILVDLGLHLKDTHSLSAKILQCLLWTS